MSDYDHPPSAKRKLLFYLIVFGCVWLVVDASCFFILRHIEKTHTLFYRFDLPTEAQVAQYYETRYHPEWGWDIDRSAKGVLGQRQHRDIEIKPRYYIKTFGNSFTYCTNVDDDETWQAYIEDNSPWDCLNFGTPGFGTDQAILKYEGSTVKSMYTILGIQDENISRCMTSNWLFYQKKFAPKPYFEVQNDTLHLTYPPQGLEALQMFASMDYVQAIARDDYWASYHKEKNFPDRNIWPSSITLIKHADFFVNTALIQIRSKLSRSFDTIKATVKTYHLYDSDSEGLLLMRHIVDRFVATAESRDEIPIIVFFPMKKTFSIHQNTGRRTYESLFTYVTGCGIHAIDLSEVLQSESASDVYMWDGHFSPHANEMTARVIVRFIRDLELSQE